jgi:two-component system OmpR family sensor kinase
VDDLFHALRAAGLELPLGMLAGAAAAVAATQLLRARRRAARLQVLASRAAALAGRPAATATAAPEKRPDAEAALALALQQAGARLEEDRAAREAFLVRALDEVRKPLSLLSTSLDLALRRRPEVPELAAALRQARAEAERISRLAGRLAQLRTAAASVRRSPLDLAAVARSVWQLAQPAAAQKGVSLVLDAPGPAPLHGDAALLAQALDELVANALAASRFGGAVVLRVARQGAAVVASVRDEGPGLTAEQRERAFEPFARGAGGFGPAGLGLALVREIARGHGGEARLGEATKGTAVVLELPAG